MDIINYSKCRGNLASVLADVCSNRRPAVITRTNRPPVVVIAQADYDNLIENLHIRRDPEIVARIERADAQLDAGQCIPKTLEDVQALAYKDEE